MAEAIARNGPRAARLGDCKSHAAKGQEVEPGRSHFLEICGKSEFSIACGRRNMGSGGRQ